MKEAMQLTASHSMDLYPDKAKRLYKIILETYPEDDLSRLKSYWSLGRLAAREGLTVEADEYFSLVSVFDPSPISSI